MLYFVITFKWNCMNACDCDFCDIVQSISIKMPYFRREMKFESSSDYERGYENK